MSRQNSALASLTANYTDSDDDEHDDLSPDAATLEADAEAPVEPKEDFLHEDSSSQDGVARSAGSGGSGTLVSYNLEHDPIDDDAIDDFPRRSLEPPDDDEDAAEEKSPARASPVRDMETETVSSEDDFFPSKKVKLPVEPPGKCSAKLQEKFAKLYESKMAGKLNMNEVIQTKKMFRNPSIYEKLISHLNIDEFGTHYPQEMYDPHEWPESSFYDELAKAQKTEMDRREKERRDRTKVEFVSGTAIKKPTLPPSVSVIPTGSAQSEAEANKRKSKWDQRGVMLPILMPMAAPSQPVALPTSISSSVAAAKAKTVINAFGILPKKK